MGLRALSSKETMGCPQNLGERDIFFGPKNHGKRQEPAWRLGVQGYSLEGHLSHSLCEGADKISQLFPALYNLSLGFCV
jgi:hypothetical protein